MQSIYIEVNVPRVLAVRALQRVWKDVVFSRFSPLRCAKFAMPALPGPGWVRVRPLLSGICGSDLHLVQTRADLDVAPAALPSNQRMFLGHEVVGRIVDVGAAVTRFQPGDRVALRTVDLGCAVKELDPPCRSCAAGNYSLCEDVGEHLERLPRDMGAGWSDSFLAHQSQLYAPPADLSDEQVMLLEPAACALHGVLRRLPAAGSRVLVMGSGTIGLFTIMAVKFLQPNCTVLATARHGFQSVLARQAGADDVIDPRAAPQEIARALGARFYRGHAGGWMTLGGLDAVFDCVGSHDTITSALRLTRSRGAVVVIGVDLQPRRVDYTPVWYQEVDLIGSIGHGHENWNGAGCSTFDLATQMFRTAPFDPARLITHRFALSQFPAAIAAARDKGRSGAIKVVFDFVGCDAGAIPPATA